MFYIRKIKVMKTDIIFQVVSIMNVYDFDNTIYKGESAIDFFVYFMKRDPKLLLYVPKVIKALIRYKMRMCSSRFSMLRQYSSTRLPYSLSASSIEILRIL